MLLIGDHRLDNLSQLMKHIEYTLLSYRGASNYDRLDPNAINSTHIVKTLQYLRLNTCVCMFDKFYTWMLIIC